MSQGMKLVDHVLPAKVKKNYTEHWQLFRPTQMLIVCSLAPCMLATTMLRLILITWLIKQ